MRCQMRIIAILLFSLLPLLVSAACSSDGSTVVYVNGIFTTEANARRDLKELKLIYQNKTGDYRTKFLNGYNETHLAGAGDLIKTWWQKAKTQGVYANDYDLNTILLNLHNDLTTKKVLLVGHSQGTFYTNAMYNYLLSHGADKESVGVYNIATPASFVEGGGEHLNSSGDALLYLVQGMGFTPLPFNIDLVSSAEDLRTQY